MKRLSSVLAILALSAFVSAASGRIELVNSLWMDAWDLGKTDRQLSREFFADIKDTFPFEWNRLSRYTVPDGHDLVAVLSDGSVISKLHSSYYNQDNYYRDGKSCFTVDASHAYAGISEQGKIITSVYSAYYNETTYFHDGYEVSL